MVLIAYPWLGEVKTKERIVKLCAKGIIAIDLRGLELLQRKDSESEEQAWQGMRGKVGSGRHLESTRVSLRQSVPAATGGSNLQPHAVAPAPPPTVTIPNNPVEEGSVRPSIFDDVATYTPVTAPATSSLNLLGRVESWGIGAGTQLQALNLRVDKLTGAQLQELIQRLPDGLTYGLELQKEDS